MSGPGVLMNMTAIIVGLFLMQVEPERLTLQEEKELNEMLAATLKAKPGEYALQLSDASIKRQFDLSTRIAQLGMLKINRAIHDKKYESSSDFVGFYVSRFGMLYEPKMLRNWVLAYAENNKQDRDLFTKALKDTGLKGEKRNTVLYSFYTILYPAERLFYIEIVGIVYKNGEADFSKLNKRAKDWIATRNDMFP
jgi:hypothetical protein